MYNVLKDIPYSEEGMGKRKVADTKELLIMQAALGPGQAVPQHEANSNVHLLILEGNVAVNLAGKDIFAGKGDIVPVSYKTLMNVRNTGSENATFLIIKTPNPSEIGK